MKMKTIYVNEIKVQILPEYDDTFIVDNLEILLENNHYNKTVDWEEYRRFGLKVKNRRRNRRKRNGKV